LDFVVSLGNAERAENRTGDAPRLARSYGCRMRELSDCIVEDARILFVGINPGLRSGAIGHHFAGKGNPFWRLLYAAGLTPRLLAPEEDLRLAEFGLGLTNLCARPTRSAAELGKEEIEEGRKILEKKIRRLRPRVVAFVGLTNYQNYFGHKKTGGAGEKPERIHGARVFVVPNPSGLNQSFPGFSDKLVWFVKLREFVQEVERAKE
jgi:TDG/mug DNA glycosylase family protein